MMRPYVKVHIYKRTVEYTGWVSKLVPIGEVLTRNDSEIRESWEKDAPDCPPSNYDAGGAGTPGPQGPEGPAGPQGGVGPQGPAGNDGAQGPKGDTGDTGPQGETGPQGPAGNDGIQGPPGNDGAQGLKGDKGDTGDTGPQGAPGDVSAAWPIGSVFISVVSTNPATLLGLGTWSAFAAGRVLVGFNAADADFDAAEKTGGSKTHTLSVQEMPSHTHVQNSHTHTQQPHSHTYASQTATTGGASSYEHGAIDTSSTAAESTISTNAATATNDAATAVNQNTGGGSAHNNVQPFITVFMWKRTA
jgi:microcystin-dependent protein